MREMMGGHAIIQYKWVVMARIATLCLVLTAGFTLVYEVTLPGEPAAADKIAPVVPGVAAVRKEAAASAVLRRNSAIKNAVLKWMRKNSDMPDDVLSRIYDSALRSGDADLVLAVCAVESSFNPTARSDKGAIGLMGIMPGVWLRELKKRGVISKRRDLYKIPDNIASGAYVLERYIVRTGNIGDALTGYAGGDPSYAQKVLHEMGEIYLVRRAALSGRSA